MKIRWSVVVLVILGIVAALSAAVFTASLNVGKVLEAAPRPDPNTDILVALRDIPASTPVKADMIGVESVLKDQIPGGAFIEPTQIIGKTMTVPLVEGQAFTLASFPPDSSGAHLASTLPPGKRAATIELTNYAGMEGLLYPGSVVDVIVSFQVSDNRKIGKAVSTTLLQSVSVLAVANLTVGFTPKEEEETPSSRMNARPLITLLVDSRQAEALQLAVKYGAISLAMRNPTDNQEIDTDATLLSEGRLARLAEFMGPSVLSDQRKIHYVGEYDSVRERGAADVEAPRAPAIVERVVHQSSPLLRIDVIRGVTFNTRSFSIPIVTE